MKQARPLYTLLNMSVLMIALILIGIGLHGLANRPPQAAPAPTPTLEVNRHMNDDFSVLIDGDVCVVDGLPRIISFDNGWWVVTYQRKNGDIVALKVGAYLLLDDNFSRGLIKLATGVCPA